MRENKYRGRRLDNGEWEYGDLVQFGQKCYTPCKCAIIPGTASGSDPLCKILFDYEVDPATVGQYTGLKDRNGREIYEGDIIGIRTRYELLVPDSIELDTLGKSETGTAYFVVKWDDRQARFIKEYKCRKGGQESPRWMACLSIHGNVYGNIHNNPELFKMKELR